MGGSLYGRFGFSDVLTFFLALDTQVELYHAGRVSLEEFSKMPKDRDILVRVIVKKHSLACTYLAHRNTRTDFPVWPARCLWMNGKEKLWWGQGLQGSDVEDDI